MIPSSSSIHFFHSYIIINRTNPYGTIYLPLPGIVPVTSCFEGTNVNSYQPPKPNRTNKSLQLNNTRQTQFKKIKKTTTSHTSPLNISTQQEALISQALKSGFHTKQFSIFSKMCIFVFSCTLLQTK